MSVTDLTPPAVLTQLPDWVDRVIRPRLTGGA
jgi:hypothetical protein